MKNTQSFYSELLALNKIYFFSIFDREALTPLNQ